MTFPFNKCPFCGRENCKRESVIAGDWQYTESLKLTCSEIAECIIHPSIWEGNYQEVVKRFTMIYLHLIKHPYISINGYELRLKFFYEQDSIGKIPNEPQKINVAGLMRNYPKSFVEKMNMGLLNISNIYKEYGDDFVGNDLLFHYLYCSNWEKYSTEITGTLDRMFELGYLNKSRSTQYIISARGWGKISELESNTKSINQGFIAMSFKNETKIISDTFKKAITKCGYLPQRIDEKEHNNQIVPEILFEITRSKFVVVDITYPNYGAYYEAGYAEALEKEVIVCCRDKEFNGEGKPHFDIAQKSMIVWNDEKDLEERLYRRIEATVGLNL